MGSSSSSLQITNFSRRNVRVFVSENPLEIDRVIGLYSGGEETSPSWKSFFTFPGEKKFSFRTDTQGVRVLASQTHEVAWKPEHFLSVFVEDEQDENICSKQIMHNMKPKAPTNVLLYDL